MRATDAPPPAPLPPVRQRLHRPAVADGSLLSLHNEGTQGVSHQVFPNAWLPFASAPHTVAPHSTATYTWDALATDGRYDFSVYGPDRFLRRFAGTVVPGFHTDVALPGASATLVVRPQPELRAAARPTAAGRRDLHLTSNDFVTKTVTRRGPRRAAATVAWPVDEWGYYDVVVTANTGDGFRYRFAGRVS